MKTIAIICLTPFGREPRVLRTINALKQDYNLLIFSDGSKYENFESINVANYNVDYEVKFSTNKIISKFQSFTLKLNKENFPEKKYFEKKYWRNRIHILNELNKHKFDVLIGHGIYTLPVLASINTKKIFNAHEYYLKELEDNKVWLKYSQPYYRYILENFLPKIDLIFSVNKIIGNEYKNNFGSNYIEITNATDYAELKPSSVGDKISIVHHGAAIRNRELEIMIDCVNLLPHNYELSLMLVKTDEVYYNELLKYKSNKIKFIDAVDVKSIAYFINKFDIGLFILPPVNYNWLNALPNKLFEYIQACLCIAVSPNPIMKELVVSNNIGIVAKDYSAKAMADEIVKLSTNQIQLYKNNSNSVAKKLNGSVTATTIKESVASLLN